MSIIKDLDLSTVEDPPPCRHCGACLWAGGFCCDGMKADHEAYIASPEYQEKQRQAREAAKLRKAERKAAKRARRLLQLANRNK